MEIFEQILGSDHPETQDARDILSKSTTPATKSVFGLDDNAEPPVGLDVGWGVQTGDAGLESKRNHQNVSSEIVATE